MAEKLKENAGVKKVEPKKKEKPADANKAAKEKKHEKIKETKAKKELKKTKEIKKDFEKIDAFKSLNFVLMTEKAIQLIETQNKLAFVVRRSSTKSDIKKSIEHVFQTPVSKVNTVIDQAGRKKAFVKFAKPGEAGEIAIRLGII